MFCCGQSYSNYSDQYRKKKTGIANTDILGKSVRIAVLIIVIMVSISQAVYTGYS